MSIPARRLLRRFLRGTEGTAAIEFGLIAPLLVMAIVTAYDLSRMVETRRGLVSVVRAGVEAGLRDGPNVETKVAQAMLAAQHLYFGAEALQPTQTTFTKVCACPGSPNVAQPCTSAAQPVYPCGTTVAELVFYVFTATTRLDMLVFPERVIDTSATLQKL